MAIHTDEKPFLSVKCAAGFVTGYTVKTHMRIQFDKKTFQCTKCDKRFQWKGSVKRHCHTNGQLVVNG